MIKLQVIINDRSDGKTQIGMMWDETYHSLQGSEIEQKFATLTQVAMNCVGEAISQLSEDNLLIVCDDFSSDISKVLKKVIEEGK